MLLLAFILFQTELPHYDVVVDPSLLDELVSDPSVEMEIPAVISYDGVSGECTIAFRGGTSLSCAKKSWHITVSDSYLFPDGGHILLNAQFRDASLMRNTLGLWITRKLGYPSPQTEFVTYSINGDNMGVYERVERIDRLFYERNGLAFGPLFKNVDTMGRFAHHFSDTTALAGYEPKVDSYPYGDQLLELLEACFRNDVSSLEVNEVLAAFAVYTAIGDNDGVIKNFYIHKYDEIWHYYPWDRDATFGNTWKGEYDSNWVTRSHLGDIGNFGATRGILLAPENMLNLNNLLQQTGRILKNDLPLMVDSIRLLIRDELALDPYYQYSVSQFDSLCLVMINDIQNRADFLTTISLTDEIPKIEEISISSCLDMESTIQVDLTLDGGDPHAVACLYSIDGQLQQWHYMESGQAENEWEIEVPVPVGTYSIRFSFGPLGPSNLPVFYPSWGMREFHIRPDPVPAARVALADLAPDYLSPGVPVWCGENLWVLPVTNTASEQQDISLCRFSLGNPAGNVFLTESILVAPGETFYLTNSSERARLLYEDFNVYGDAGTSYPAGSSLKLFDPSWNSLYSWQISAGDSLPVEYGNVFPSEISAGDDDDWVELYNHSEYGVDLSQWYFMDSDKNVSLLPEGTSLAPGGLLLFASEPASFQHLTGNVIPLDFSITSESDSLFLYSRLGDRVFCVTWDESWPIKETGIMYLIAPYAAVTSKENWEASTPPGSPGELNPGWTATGYLTDIFLTSPNPGNGFFSFHYRTPTIPAEVIIYDLAGRVRSRILIQENYVGDVTADFSDTLPSGVYILYLRSSGASASTRFTVLN